MKHTIARQYASEVTASGNLSPHIRDEISRLLKSLSGKRVVIKIALWRNTRSNKQNKFYYGVVIPLVKAMFVGAGNVVSEEDVHEFLKNRVGKLSKLVTDPNGEVHSIPRSSADLDTIEFETWMTQIRAWGADYGLEIPMPTQFWEREEK